MARAFADITFTESVKAAQEKYGSREMNRSFEEAEDPVNTLGVNETHFIEQRDSFYMATTNQNGWPYVQHRGGPKGFIKVIDNSTLGFADFRGNRQYLSVGNLNSDDRISLILMDYPNKARLKIWGQAKIVHVEDEPGLLDVLEVPTYRARIERAMLITIEAIEWNCPQHITPRFTEEEINQLIKPLREENISLKEQHKDSAPILGDGPLALKITGITQQTPRIRSYRLESVNDQLLPAAQPGAHIQVPVILENGSKAQRSYSICSETNNQHFYEIAVLNDLHGRGGSCFVHASYALGTELRCQEPTNYFTLHTDDRPAILVAGGIGITPIKAMANSLAKDHRPFHLHYAGRELKEMAYLQTLQKELGEKITTYSESHKQIMDITALLHSSPENSLFYICGPIGLIEAFQKTADMLGVDQNRIRSELFASTPTTEKDNAAVNLTLQRSNKTIEVPADQSLLSAMLEAGVNIPYSCETGNCKTCAVEIIEGKAEHRDGVLTNEDKTIKKLICPCVSRATTKNLTLNI